MIKACNHFGWEYNSPVVRTYIRRKNLIEEDETDKRVTEISLESMEKKLTEMKLAKDIEVEDLRGENEKIRFEFDILKSGVKKLLGIAHSRNLIEVKV